MDLCKQNIDFNARLVGSPSVNIWLGQDGFDYHLQTDYTKQWDYLIGNVRELADYNPDIKLTLEGDVYKRQGYGLQSSLRTAEEARDRQSAGHES